MNTFMKKIKDIKEMLLLITIIMTILTVGSNYLWATIITPKIDERIETKLDPIRKQLDIIITFWEKYDGDERYTHFNEKIEIPKRRKK